MTETQNIEYKQTWRDEYLKWICGFANASGGRIYIGLKDSGEICGVSNAKKLLEEIPNKIKDTMGIIADVNLLSKNQLDYIEIIVQPSSYPVSYKGEYHYRSGCTKQQLRGAALTEFLVEKTGLCWDAVPVDYISADELDNESIDIFRREALKKGRILEEDLDISNEELLQHLDLLDNTSLKRAAVMLFYKRPSRIITGCYVKIGKFNSDSDLEYQDSIEGSLFNIADHVIDLLYTKYLKATISYEHDVRIETYPFLREAVREVIYNALGHNNYAASVPIQIRVEDEALYISNSCILPRGWTVQTLLEKHRSIPFNPSIANVFYRAGYIEAWGRGIQKVMNSCAEKGFPLPQYSIVGDSLTVKFVACQKDKSVDGKNGGNCGGKADGNRAEGTGGKSSDGGKGAGNSSNESYCGGVLGGKSGGKVGGKVEGDFVADLSDKEKLVLLEIEQNPKVTTARISKACRLARRTVERIIKSLKDKQIIIRNGSSRNGSWKIII